MLFCICHETKHIKLRVTEFDQALPSPTDNFLQVRTFDRAYFFAIGYRVVAVADLRPRWIRTAHTKNSDMLS